MPVGWVRLASSDDPDLALVTELGASAPRVTQGYGVWQEIDRRARTALTTWTGRRPLGVEMELFFDSFADGDGLAVEAAVSMLEGLAGRGPHRRQGEPPPLVIDAAGVVPFDVQTAGAQSTRWVISDLAWDGDATIYNQVGNRVRTQATVTLLEHVADVSLAAQASIVRSAITTAGKRPRRPYIVKPGDDAVGIAKNVLKDPGRWREIADLNDIRDPRTKLTTGRKLKMPA